MNLTPEQKEVGRRNFLKAVAGTPALAALIGATATQGPKSGGPVRIALIGAGGEGKVLLNACQKGWVDLKAICDINPKHALAAAEGMAGKGWPKPATYQDIKQMFEKENIEAVLVATPLWTHADISVAALDAGKHVLCEKMMAWDVEGCRRMADAAKRNHRLLEIGYQRMYNPAYLAAYEGIIKKGLLGEIHYVRNVWHRNTDWRRNEKPPSPEFDPKQWGYQDWEHLVNWRLYRKHSRGLLAELGSHQVAIANWFLASEPEAVYTSAGIHRYKDGREVPDHVYSTFDYPGGVTATFTTIQSNEYEDYYEQLLGTKGTLIFKRESEVYLFGEGDAKQTNLEVTPRTSGNAIVDASESRAADASGAANRTVAAAGTTNDKVFDRLLGYKNEIAGLCSAIRSGIPLRCGPEKAMGSATACIRAFEAGDKKARINVA
jgi:predicted dehydrogenase